MTQEPDTEPRRRATDIDPEVVESLDPMTAPPNPKLGFWGRFRWIVDPYFCASYHYDGKPCRRRVTHADERCWDCWVQLFDKGDNSQLSQLAGDPGIPEPIAQRLAAGMIGNRNKAHRNSVKTALAQNSGVLSARVQELLATSEPPVIQRLLAERSDLQESAIRILVEVRDVLCWGYLVENPLTPEWALRQIAAVATEITQATAATAPESDLSGLVGAAIARMEPEADDEPAVPPEPLEFDGLMDEFFPDDDSMDGSDGEASGEPDEDDEPDQGDSTDRPLPARNNKDRPPTAGSDEVSHDADPDATVNDTDLVDERDVEDAPDIAGESPDQEIAPGNGSESYAGDEGVAEPAATPDSL